MTAAGRLSCGMGWNTSGNASRHYLLARLKHDGEWLAATARRIRAGELTWPGEHGQ